MRQQYSSLGIYNNTRELYHTHQADLHDLVHQLQRMHIILFINSSPDCHLSSTCMDKLKQYFGEQLYNIFIIKDLGVPANQELFRSVGAKVVPTFYSLKTGKLSVSCQNLGNMIHELNNTENFHEPTNNLKDLDIDLYVMDSCGYCTKMKQMLRKAGVLEQVNIISNLRNRPELKNVRGFPYMISKKTGKSHTGYVDNVAQLIENLS